MQNGWLSSITLVSALGALLAFSGFVHRECDAAAPMLDLALLRIGPVRGAALVQLGGSITLASVMFGLTLHFRPAYGWSPLRAGLTNLPMIIAAPAATPIAEQITAQLGHRWACVLSAACLVGFLAGMAWAVEIGYLPIAIMMVCLTIGLRTVDHLRGRAG